MYSLLGCLFKYAANSTHNQSQQTYSQLSTKQTKIHEWTNGWINNLAIKRPHHTRDDLQTPWKLNNFAFHNICLRILNFFWSCKFLWHLWWKEKKHLPCVLVFLRCTNTFPITLTFLVDCGITNLSLQALQLQFLKNPTRYASYCTW